MNRSFHIVAALRSKLPVFARFAVGESRCTSGIVSLRRRKYKWIPDLETGRGLRFILAASTAAYATVLTYSQTKAYALAPASEPEERLRGNDVQDTLIDRRSKPSSVSQLGRFAVADAVERVGPSVVNIRRTTRRSLSVRKTTGFFSSLPTPFSEGPVPGLDATQVSGGSGFIVANEDKKYFILTNSHVVQDMMCPGCEHCSGKVANNENIETELEVTLASGESFIGTLTAADPTSDLAVVCIETDSALPVAELGDSDALRPGEFVVAVGSPLQVLSNSCSFGIVSSVHRDLEPATGANSGGMTFLQVDCAINPGSSGGPLVDLDGKVLGVCSMKIGGVNSSNVLGQDEPIAVEGISFAIPIAFARKVMSEFKLHGQVRRPYVGLALVAINKETVSEIKDNTEFFVPDWLQDASKTDISGLLVHNVDKGSPGEAASLKRGDVITSVDGIEMRTTNDFMSAIAFKFEDSKVLLQVRRAATGAVETVTASPAVIIPDDPGS
jgi:S1-C subfamily serine protease